MEEEAGEMKKTNKNGECVDVQVSESHEAEMKDMLKDLMEMSRSVALGQERTESRLVEEISSFRNESNARMERLEGNVEDLRRRVEQLEADREEDRLRLKNQVVERRW